MAAKRNRKWAAGVVGLRLLRGVTPPLLILCLISFLAARSADVPDASSSSPARPLVQADEPVGQPAAGYAEVSQEPSKPPAGPQAGTEPGEDKQKEPKAKGQERGEKKQQPDAKPKQKPEQKQQKSRSTEKPEAKKQKKPKRTEPAPDTGKQEPRAGGKPAGKYYWEVEEIRIGMKGRGLSVFRGTKIEEFEAEVLGVQRNVDPGRDIILVRLRGCGLEHTGVIAGMSGSPIYIDGKLLGAVAYTWSFGKAPIAGVTPFCQMLGHARALESATVGRQQSSIAAASRSAGTDVRIWSRRFRPARATQHGNDGLDSAFGLTRIKVPLIAAGFSARTVAMLDQLLGTSQFVSAVGGKVTAEIMERAAAEPIRPGSPLAIALVTGDFDMSSLGTVTHVDGDRVYGFGHPMLGAGKCELPLMSGYVHVVYPRQTISMKLGSPLKIVGTIDTDVSTCVAGRLGTKPAMIPMAVSVKRAGQPKPRNYKVNLIRDPDWMPALVLTVLMAAIDAEGELPEEVTLQVRAEIKPEGHRSLVVQDVYSGSLYSGSMGAAFAYNVIPNVINNLVRNDIKRVNIEWIKCSTEIIEGRSSAAIRQVRLNSDVLEPGDELIAHVQLEPYKGSPRWTSIKLELPENLQPGRYRVTVCDAITAINDELRSKPYLLDPKNLADLYHVLELQLAERRKDLHLRVTTPEIGIAQDGTALPDLPLSVVQILTRRRSTPPTLFRSAISAKLPTDYVLQGSSSVYFNVVSEKGFYD